MKNTFKLATLALAAGALVGCESATDVATTGSTDVRAVQFINPPVVTDPAPFHEGLKICKVWNGGSALSTDFDVTLDGSGLPGETTQTVGLLDGECKFVAQFDGINPATLLRVVESVPTGATLVDIQVDATVRNGAMVSDYGVTTNVGTGTFEASNADNNVGFTVTFVNEVLPPPPGGGEGCTPGYWKNHAGPDSFSRGGQKKPSSWVGYAPGDDFDTVFGVTSDFGGTLMDALVRGGGGEKALGRHAVAALLNAASSVDYDLTEAEVIQLVQDAYDGLVSFNDAKDELAALNEQGCPL